MGANCYYMRFPEGRTKAITLSYDDGVEQDERLIQLMEQYGFKGTFNLSYGCTPPEGVTYEPGRVHRRMPFSWLKRVYASANVEVAIHGLTHPHLERYPASKVMHEIIEDRKGWEEFFGGVIRGMAYPYGTYSDEVVEVLRLAGICYSRTTKSTERFDLPTDWLRLPATCHHKNPRLMELADNFASMEISGEAKLFYLWGHSYEFEGDQNWTVIENFFKRLTGMPDTWYATNIEIYDYIQAYERLYYSSDGQRVQNPSVIDVWLGTRKGEVIYVPAGKTVDLK
ncbi:MAG: polysaccharide deacetylase family protein [Clostridia bacterium]|nr:polysaccharide deacetylase family protein [Clostridia bacterium]